MGFRRRPQEDLFAPLLWFMIDFVGMQEGKKKGKEWTRRLFSESLLDLSPHLFILLCISCVREVLKGIYHSAFHAEIIINPRVFLSALCTLWQSSLELQFFLLLLLCVTSVPWTNISYTVRRHLYINTEFCMFPYILMFLYISKILS